MIGYLLQPQLRRDFQARSRPSMASTATWQQLEAQLPSALAPEPLIVDSALAPEKPALSDDGVVLYRERNGWCPYSERVWLALEHKGLPFETVLIDNTGGGRPAWYSGETPQLRWPDGRTQKESLDLVRALDAAFPEAPPLWPPSGGDASDVGAAVAAFKATFPRSARPSSRAAFLFDWDGGALPRATFEATLDATDELLARHGGPFFVGADFSAADVAWAPFLERYAAQLPCLHRGLVPRDPARWPRLAAWYEAMEAAVPAYACRVRGDAPSWRRVLGMAGFGNAGLPPRLLDNAAAADAAFGAAPVGQATWASYAADRAHVAPSPAAEAAARLTRNRAAVAADAGRRRALDGAAEGKEGKEGGEAAAAIDGALREVVGLLLAEDVAGSEGDAPRAPPPRSEAAAALLRYLDARLCVPRDMGAPAAAAIRAVLDAV